MLKIVVFDSGYGGELFADRLEAELPVVEVIRVIDWRNADIILTQPKTARKIAENDLRPYIGRVDLIIFANYLLTMTSLKYFQRKYKKQKFLGLNLEKPSTFIKNDILILTTKALTRVINYHNFVFNLKRKSKALILDDWVSKIDDGELDKDEIKKVITESFIGTNFNPKEVIIGCGQFCDIKTEIREILGGKTRIYDGFDNTIGKTHKTLNIRGGNGKKRKR